MVEVMAKSSKTTKPRHLNLRPRLSISAWMLIVISGFLGLAYAPISILVFAGMIPTIIAFLIDQDARRSTTITVGLMNAAGVSPFVLTLWEQGSTIKVSLGLLRHGMTWLVMYGSAAGGCVILFIIPPIVHVALIQKARHRIIELEKRQILLRSAWGDEVENPKSPV